MKPYCYRECATGRRFILRVDPGARLVASLLDFVKAEGIGFASLVSAVGSVRDVAFEDIQAGAHLPLTGARIKTHRLEGPLQLIGLEGSIVPDATGEPGAQLSILGAKSSGEVVGGRLVEAEVFATCELVLAEYLAEGIERHHAPASGVGILRLSEGGKA